MLCEECKSQGLKSQVYEGLTCSTAMYCQPFYDENGKYHHHDMNNLITTYSCSQGHSFSKSYKPTWICCEKKENE